MHSDIKKSIYLKSESCEVTDLGEGCFMIFEPETAMTYVLNNIMSFLWDGCDGERNVEVIIQDLIFTIMDTEIPHNQIFQECIEAFQNLENVGIIRKKQTTVC